MEDTRGWVLVGCAEVISISLGDILTDVGGRRFDLRLAQKIQG